MNAKKNMDSYLEEISKLVNEVQEDVAKGDKGNKAAITRVRVNSMAIINILKQLRGVALETRKSLETKKK